MNLAEAGQTTGLDEEQKGGLLALLKLGCTRRIAAKYVGCSLAELRRGAKLDPAFAAAIRQAEVGHEALSLRQITEAAKKNWRAASWLLERHYPDRYAARKPGVVTPEQVMAFLEEIVRIVTEEVPVAQYRQKIYRRLRKLRKRVWSASSPRPMP